jgi:two-component system, LytTR family, sensor kinase
MGFKNKLVRSFWVFLFMAVFLQLGAEDEVPLITALICAVCVVLTFRIYFQFLTQQSVLNFLSGLNSLLLSAAIIGFSFVVALLLSVEGYTIIKLTMSETAGKSITDSGGAFFGLFTISGCMSGLIYLFEKYRASLEQEKELETLKHKSLEMEISLLRNQLSPHFTFNILNNLQFLIRKDTEGALHLLSVYSKILRYYVYESQRKLIALDHEIAFLKEYFDLEFNRHVEQLEITCEWNIPENDFQIVPFILSTFVENAFKHVLPNQANEYFIRQSCTLNEQGSLVFEIVNSYDESVAAGKTRGIGLKHVEARLNLAYNNRHHLNIEEKNGVFSVRVELNNLEK